MTCDVEHDFVCLWPSVYLHWGFPDSSVGKESTCKAEDLGLIPGSGRSAGEGIGDPLQYFWPGEFHGLYSPWVAKSQT